jgi:hypothetical protein
MLNSGRLMDEPNLVCLASGRVSIVILGNDDKVLPTLEQAASDNSGLNEDSNEWSACGHNLVLMPLSWAFDTSKNTLAASFSF